MKPTWVTWVIEKGLFVDTEERLIGELKRQGIGYRELQYVPFDDDLVKRCEGMFPKGSCVVFYGSLNFGRKLKRTSWIPGVYLDDRKYDCTAYYPVFGNDLLHSDYIMLPYGELTRRKDFLFEHFGYNMTHDCELFMRPNSGFKQFVGTVLDYDRFDDGVKLSGFYDVEPDTLVIVSKAKRLHKEWRFVVVRDKATRERIAKDAARQPFIGTAPVLLACCAEGDGRVMRCGQAAYPIDVAIAMDHLSLAAAAEGLGTCWIGSFDEGLVKQILGIPTAVRVVELMPLGYPVDPSPAAKSRMNMEEILHTERW